jgi:hypothetical protein
MQRSRRNPSLSDSSPWSVGAALAWAAVACGLALAGALFV